jgi:hypothetical protein
MTKNTTISGGCFWAILLFYTLFWLMTGLVIGHLIGF